MRRFIGVRLPRSTEACKAHPSTSRPARRTINKNENIEGNVHMKMTVLAALAVGALALTACSQKTEDKAATAAEATGDAAASAGADAAANTEAAADSTAAAVDNAADATAEGAAKVERKADAAADAAAKQE